MPVSKVSILLWTLAGYIGSDAATRARHEEVLRRLGGMGYRNVEPFTLSGWTAGQCAAVLDEYGLKASGFGDATVAPFVAARESFAYLTCTTS